MAESGQCPIGERGQTFKTQLPLRNLTLLENERMRAG
jgi:hypothetical protein